MLSTDEFKVFSGKVVPFLSIMSKIEDRKDDALLRTYGFGGFPSIAFLDADGNKLMKQGARTVEGFNESLTKVDAFVKLNAKAEAGDESAIVPALIAQMNLGGIDYAGAQAKAKGAKFTKDQKLAFTTALIPLLATLPLDAAKIELKGMKLNDEQNAQAQDILVGLEIAGHLKNARRDNAAAAKVAFYKIWKDGRSPKAYGSNASRSYWGLLMAKATEDSDVKLFEAAWGVIRPAIAKNPRAARYVETQDAKLKELKGDDGDDDGDDDDDDEEKKDGEHKK